MLKKLAVLAAGLALSLPAFADGGGRHGRHHGHGHGYRQHHHHHGHFQHRPVVVVPPRVVYAPAPGFVAPYRVGYVDLPDGVRVFTQIDAPVEARIPKGTQVSLVFRPFASDGTQSRVGFAFTTRDAEKS